MYQRSGIEDAIRGLMYNHKTLYIYKDPAYHYSFGIAAPFTDPRGRRWLSIDKQRFNKALSSV